MDRIASPAGLGQKPPLPRRDRGRSASDGQRRPRTLRLGTVCARRLLIAFLIAVYMGLRRNEIFRMHVQDVDLAASIIWVRPHGKALKTSASCAPIPIPAALLPSIIAWLGHRLDAPYGYPLPAECPWMIPTNDRRSPWLSGDKNGRPIARLQAVARRAGVPYVTWQMCRRSCATMLEHHGLGRPTIKRILCHATSAPASGFTARPISLPCSRP